MPTYEYRCNKCGHEFEEFQSITAEPLKTCPECSGDLKRLMGTGAGIIFKGSGFYATDYRSPTYSTDSKKDQKSDKKSESSDKKTEKPSEKKISPDKGSTE